MKIPQGRVTNALVLITGALFVILWAIGQIDYAAIVGGFIPARIGNPALISGMDGLIGPLPVWITPITATLVHANWTHIGFNMLTLLFCGRYVEHVLGGRLLLLLYGVGAYAAAGTEWLFAPGAASPMIGASGAISAVMGTYALLYSHQKVRAIGPISANIVRIAWLAAAWTGIQLMIGLASNGSGGGIGGMGQIAIGAHIGGFIAGLILTRPVLHLRFRKRPVGLGQG